MGFLRGNKEYTSVTLRIIARDKRTETDLGAIFGSMAVRTIVIKFYYKFYQRST